MLFYILLYHLIGYISTRPHKIAYCPQMFPPILSLQLRVFYLYLSWCFAFQKLHHSTHGMIRGYCDINVDVISWNCPSYYLHSFILTDPSYQISCSHGNISNQHWIPIFCHPHQVISAFVHRMASPFIIAHTWILPPVLKRCTISAELTLKMGQFIKQQTLGAYEQPYLFKNMYCFGSIV